MATKLSRRDVLRVAELARLTLTEAEVETFARQLTDILDWVDQIQRAGTEGVDPTAHASDVPGAWREDAVTRSVRREEIFEQAPDADVDAGLFRVPRVL